MNRSNNYGSVDDDDYGDDEINEFTHDLSSFSQLLGRSFDSSSNDVNIIKRTSRDNQNEIGKNNYYNLSGINISANSNYFIGSIGFIIALILIIVVSTNTSGKTTNERFSRAA